MNPVNDKACSRHFKKPDNWNDRTMGDCVTLPVSLESFGGVEFMCSFWKPTPGELSMLNSGQAVKLGIAGSQHPVVFVSVQENELSAN